LSDTWAKIITVVTTFVIIFGGWFLFRYYQAQQLSTTPLPGTGGRQGHCVLWFIGSSSVYRWSSLDADMKPWIAHNRGIEAATFAELGPRFAHEREKREPEAIVLYAGENDIARGGTPVKALADLSAFLDEKVRHFGDLRVFIISMKPSPTRWANFADQSRFNAEAAAIARRRPDVTFINIVPLLLVNGRPGNFYQSDGIHMNPDGYRLWAKAVREALGRTLPARVTRSCDPAFGHLSAAPSR